MSSFGHSFHPLAEPGESHVQLPVPEPGTLRVKRTMLGGLIVWGVTATVAFVITLSLLTHSGGGGGSGSGDGDTRPAVSEFVQAVDRATMLDHLAGLVAAGVPMRSEGTGGFEASVDYVVAALGERAPTMEVTLQPFEFEKFVEAGPTALRRLAPAPAADLPTRILSYSGTGSVNASVSVVHHGGCEAGDFGDFLPDTVALIARGNCSFFQKASGAIAAGAIAVVIHDDDLFSGTLGDPLAVPVVATTHAAALTLLPEDARVYVETHGRVQTVASTNVIAETPAAAASDRLIVIGSHLDSVDAGPGINDNGSGCAVNLQLAELVAQHYPGAAVRHIFFGGEESGLQGSRYYANALSEDEARRVHIACNYDMLGSPNGVAGIFEGESDAERAISRHYVAYFEATGRPYTTLEFNGRSDYQPFRDVGIAAGGLETGAEVKKTVEERDVFGGVNDVAYDPCYHSYCDTMGNIDVDLLEVMAEAAAFVLERAVRGEA